MLGIFMKKRKNKRIYLDYASATPISKEVQSVIKKNLDVFANPSALYQEGLLAKDLLEASREKISFNLGSHRDEIFFLSGATESDNQAIKGVVKKFKQDNPGKTPHIVTTNIEHSAILETCKALETEGAEVTYLEVDEKGIVDLKKLRESLKENTVLVSVIWASNEIGVVQPIKEIIKSVRHFKKHDKGNHESVFPLVHSDASQAINYIDINTTKLGIDLLTCNSEKIYGPKGIGLLFVKRKTPITRIIEGGEQESGMRPGTENVIAAAGFSKAFELAVKNREKESKRLQKIRDYCFDQLKKNFKEIVIFNGSLESRLPNNVNVSFRNFDSELMIIELDAKGISVSSRSACNIGDDAQSYVLRALGVNPDDGSVRITLGKYTKRSDIDSLIKALKSIFKKYTDIK